MSQPKSKPKQKSPYGQPLASCKTRVPLRRYTQTKSTEQEYRKYHSSSRNLMRELQLNLGRGHSHQKELFSDRKSLERKKGSLTKNENMTIRLSKSPQHPPYSKGEKSTAISSLLASQQQRQAKVKEERRQHELGKNCRVIVIEGSEEAEHFVEVAQMGDILAALKKEYPRTSYYRAVPIQITLDYLLTQENVSGQFLNGQTLYLKPAGRDTSVDERQALSLDSFQILKLIGSGGFSKVYLCRLRRDGQFYAMKVIDKEVIVKNKKKNIIMNERNIMRASKHPFLIEMRFAFETERFLVFVVEYCPGGELFSLIKRYRRLSEDISRFYIIEIFLGLSYLHQSHVVYRDIKPQNILLGKDGHVKIADLGLAKPDMFEGELAYSFCGSPEYMSPEMILQVGHTYPVDFYCMGALLYELLIGLPPFYSRDTNQIYEAVLAEELDFPEDVPLTTECKSLLRGLLCKDAKQRLGSIHGVKQILAHPWFGKNSYKNFLEKAIPPPITFDSVGRIDLDRQTDDKNKRDVDQLIKISRTQSRRFKRQMKNFYFDYRGLTEQLREGSGQKENREKSLLRSASGRRLNPNSTLNRSSNLMMGLQRKGSQKELNKTLNSSRR